MNDDGFTVLDARPTSGGHQGSAGFVDRELTGLAGSDLSERFRSWRGRSGRRYIFSIFPDRLHDQSSSLGPDFAEAVVIAASLDRHGTRRIVRVATTDRYPDLFFHGTALAEARAAGATEIHIHLLATNKAERRAIAEDLDGL